MDDNTFQLTADNPAILYLKKRDKRLEKLFNLIGDIECHEHLDSFSFIVEEIVGQMLSNKVADVICDRLNRICCGTLTVDTLSGKTVEELRAIGLSAAKSQYILAFTETVRTGHLDLERLSQLSDAEVMTQLMSVRGVGSWTAKMFLLFVLKRPDILPCEDGAFLQSFKWLYNCAEKPKRTFIEQKCKKWKPYSSTAARYLYRALDMGLTKTPFHLK